MRIRAASKEAHPTLSVQKTHPVPKLILYSRRRNSAWKAWFAHRKNTWETVSYLPE